MTRQAATKRAREYEVLKKKPTAPIVLTGEERFLATQTLRIGMKECANPIVLAVISKVLVKLEGDPTEATKS